MLVYHIFNMVFLTVASENLFIDQLTVTENEISRGALLDLEDSLIKKGVIQNGSIKNYKIYSLNDKSSVFSLISNKIFATAVIDREAICSSSNPEMKANDVKKAKLTEGICFGDDCCVIFSFQVDTNDRINEYYILIKILDQNDNYPRFLPFSNPYKTIMENSPINTIIDLPIAVDPDSSKYGIRFYDIVLPYTVGNSSHFVLQDKMVSGKAQLKLVSSLDREVTSEYRFTLRAVDRDVNENRENNAVEIEIKIGDINDNAPQFDKSVYSATIVEHSKQTEIISFKITDSDEGENQRIKVDIDAENELAKNKWKKFFQVDFSSNTKLGTIRLIDELDYEVHEQQIQFTLIAEDHGTPSLSSTAKVTIGIINRNDQVPIIRVIRNGQIVSRGITIKENESAGTMVAFIQVSDNDSPSKDIECALNDEKLNFQLTPHDNYYHTSIYKEYSIRTLKPLDREAEENRDNIILKIHCTDSDKTNPLSSNMSIFITIEDVNDNPPMFSRHKYQGEIIENIPDSEVKMIEPIRTTDSDYGKHAQVIYRIQKTINSTDWQKFSIEEQTGKIYSKTTADYEEKNFYEFRIEAIDRDKPELVSYASVVVNVIDANDNPPVFEKSHYAFSLKENSPINTVIGQITCTDKDTKPENKAIKFFEKSYDNNVLAVRIDQITGKLRTVAPIDREKLRNINLIITAKNDAQYQNINNHNIGDSECMVVITIENENDNAPSFTPSNPSITSMTFFVSKKFVRQDNCQQIPYMLSDADNDESSADDCCTLMLENNYNGIFSLVKNIPTFLCIKESVKTPATYRITIIARDNKTNPNNSLEARVSFNVIVKNEPVEREDSDSIEGISPYAKPSPYRNSNFSLIIVIIIVVLVCVLIIILSILVLYRYVLSNSEVNKHYDNTAGNSFLQSVENNLTQIPTQSLCSTKGVWPHEDIRLIHQFNVNSRDNLTNLTSLSKSERIGEKFTYPTINQYEQSLKASDFNSNTVHTAGYEPLCLVTPSSLDYVLIDRKGMTTSNSNINPNKIIDEDKYMIPTENPAKYSVTSFV